MSPMSERKAPGVHLDPASETWKSLPWRKLEQHVFRIQKRIYRASQRGNQRAVQKLQKLLLKSRAARLLAVREAREQAPAETDSGQQAAVVAQIHPRCWPRQRPCARPQRRSGFVARRERAQQTLVSMALEPVWTVPDGQQSLRALRALREALCAGGQYVLCVDLPGCLAASDQRVLLRKLQVLPAIGRQISAAREGLPVAWLVNLVLHPLYLRVLQACSAETRVVYAAGELVVLHPTLVGVQHARLLIEHWLRALEMTWQPGNLRIAHTLMPSRGAPGFDFLGWGVRHYAAGKQRETAGLCSGSLICIRPGRAQIQQHMAALKRVLDQHRAASQETVIRALNPLIEEWALSCRAVGAVAELADCDHHLWWLLWRWARRRHPHKGQGWLRQRYWHRTAASRWVFGPPTGPTLHLHARASDQSNPQAVTSFALPVTALSAKTTGITHG